MKDSIHVSKENYLKAILEAEAEGHEVIPAVLAHWLEVSAPAVTMALKRLKRDGYVEVGADGIVRLTATGRETAYRHRPAAPSYRAHVERDLSAWSGMKSTRKPSGSNMPSRLPLRPSFAKSWDWEAPVRMAIPCCLRALPNASNAARCHSPKPRRAGVTL